jgi:hypothetical protein
MQSTPNAPASPADQALARAAFIQSWKVTVYPCGRGQWAFIAGPRSGSPYGSKDDALAAGEVALAKARAKAGPA